MIKNEIFIVASSPIQNTNVTVLEAQNLYKSSAFSNCKHFVLKNKYDWLILSDMHGLLWPYISLTNYDSNSLCDLEKEHRLERALSRETVANTLISCLGLKNNERLAPIEWRNKVLRETKFTLLGNTDFLKSAGSLLATLGSTVENSSVI